MEGSDAGCSSTRFVLVHSFATIEADEARQSIERVKQGLQMELHQLRAAADDNGHWDPAYEFVTGQRANFVAENFTRSGLDTMRVHVMWVGDNAGKTLVSITTRDVPTGQLGQLDPALINRIQKYALTVVAPDSGNADVRLMRVPGGVLAFSAVRVLRSNHTGPSPGLLVFGHYFDQALIGRIEETSQSPVKLILLDEHGHASADVNATVSRWLAAPSGDTLIQTNDGETLDSYALLRDVEGRPVAVLANSVSHAALQARAGGRSPGWSWHCWSALRSWSRVLLTMVNRGWRSRAVAQRQSLDQQRQFSRLARRDVLTGLPNRVYLQKLLPRLIKRAARDSSRLALLYIDLDHFKNVNDSLGHARRRQVAAGRRSPAARRGRPRTTSWSGWAVTSSSSWRPCCPNAQVVNSIAERIRRALVGAARPRWRHHVRVARASASASIRKTAPMPSNC